MESNNTNTCLENDVLKSIEDNLKKYDNLSKQVNKEIFVEVKEKITEMKGDGDNGGKAPTAPL